MKCRWQRIGTDLFNSLPVQTVKLLQFQQSNAIFRIKFDLKNSMVTTVRKCWYVKYVKWIVSR